MKSWVYTNPENGWVAVEDVEFLDIESTPFGDVMTFNYDDTDFTSHVVFGSNPNCSG
jgi:hypothetical protein